MVGSTGIKHLNSEKKIIYIYIKGIYQELLSKAAYDKYICQRR